MFKILDYKDLEHISLIIFFKKHLGTSWLEENEDISFIGIACFSLNQLKLLSMALELILSLLILISCLQVYFLLITFKYMIMYITKGYAETLLHLRKWLTKSTHLNQWMQLPLRCALRYLNSEAEIASARWHPGFLVHLM